MTSENLSSSAPVMVSYKSLFATTTVPATDAGGSTVSATATDYRPRHDVNPRQGRQFNYLLRKCLDRYQYLRSIGHVA